MQLFGGKGHYGISAFGIIAFGAVGVHSCSVALYNAWKTAFVENAPYLNQLSHRFWLWGIISLAAFAFTIAMLVMTIRRMNREYREASKRSAD
jgi:hypothetical protein